MYEPKVNECCIPIAKVVECNCLLSSVVERQKDRQIEKERLDRQKKSRQIYWCGVNECCIPIAKVGECKCLLNSVADRQKKIDRLKKLDMQKKINRQKKSRCISFNFLTQITFNNFLIGNYRLNVMYLLLKVGE